MAFGFGTTVNPQLGATNYSGFLQGALSGAQMQAQGGAAIAQGLESAIAGAGAGVKKYLENKETKTLFDSSLPNITNTIQGNQFLRERLGITDPADKNQIRAGLKGFGGGDLRKGLNAFLQLSAESAESKRQAEGFAASFAPVTTVTPSPLAEAAGSGVRFENLPTGVASALQRIDTADPTRAQAFKRATDAGVTNPALLQAILASTSSPQEERRSAAEIAKIEADTRAIGVPKPTKIDYVTRRETDTNGVTREFTIDANSGQQVGNPAIVRPPTTVINTGDNQNVKLVADQMSTLRNDAALAARSIRAYQEAGRILKGDKTITGAGADIRLSMAKIGSLFGIANDAIANTEVVRAQLAQPVFSLIKNLGAGTAISNVDLEFAKKAAGGDINLDGAAIARLVEIGNRGAKATIKSYGQRLDKVYPKDREDIAQTRSFFELTPQEIDLATPVPDGVSISEWDAMTPEEKATFNK
jgi:hypothetical protein